MSHVTCHVSPVTLKIKIKEIIPIFFIIQKKLDKVVELVGGGSVINGATPSSFIIRMNYFRVKVEFPTQNYL